MVTATGINRNHQRTGSPTGAINGVNVSLSKMEDHITDSPIQEPDDLLDDHESYQDYQEQQADLYISDNTLTRENHDVDD